MTQELPLLWPHLSSCGTALSFHREKGSTLPLVNREVEVCLLTKVVLLTVKLQAKKTLYTDNRIPTVKYSVCEVNH